MTLDRPSPPRRSLLASTSVAVMSALAVHRDAGAAQLSDAEQANEQLVRDFVTAYSATIEIEVIGKVHMTASPTSEAVIQIGRRGRCLTRTPSSGSKTINGSST